MGVTFLSKEKAKAKTSKKDSSEVAVIVERMAAINIALASFKKLNDEYEALRKSLLSKIPEDASDEVPVVFEGTNHVVEFSARPVVRSISDMEEVRDMLGDEMFVKLAKVNLTDLDKYLTPEEVAALVKSARTGARRCEVKEV